MASLFRNIPAKLPEELVEALHATENVTIERIVSRQHASPPGFWYDQDRSEFVLVMQGSAGLRFDGKDDIIILKPGDYVVIEAHVKHRVEWTDPEMDTIWLAVHC